MPKDVEIPGSEMQMPRVVRCRDVQDAEMSRTHIQDAETQRYPGYRDAEMPRMQRSKAEPQPPQTHVVLASTHSHLEPPVRKISA